MDHAPLKKTMDFDPATGISHVFSIDEHGLATITVEQDVTPIVETNKREFNADHRGFGEWSKVASVPLSIYNDWVKQGKVHDQAFLKRFLNDPENRFFRTRPGAV